MITATIPVPKPIWWLAGGCFAALLALLATLGYLTLTHGPAIAQDIRATAGNTAQATADLKDAAASLKTAANDLQQKAAALDPRPINAALRNVEAVTGDVRAITAQVRDRYPIIEGAATMIWQHTDNTIAHLDRATQAEQTQQEAITKQTLATIQSLNQLVSDPNIALAVSHVNGAAVAVQGMAEDGHEITSTSKHLFTWPRSLWRKIRHRKS